MFFVVYVFFCFVVLVTAQRIPTWPLFGGFGTPGVKIDVDDILLSDIQDQQILTQLVRLDMTNRPLIKKILQLDITERKIIADLARGINDIIIKKATIYHLTLWDRILKIKGINAPFNGYQLYNRHIENGLIETEIEDTEMLKNLAKIDEQIVKSVLLLDAHDRKILIDLIEVINVRTLEKGPTYPIALLKRLLKINGTSNSYGGFFGQTNILGENCVSCNRGLGLINPIWRINTIGY